ncbi:hypothetical protein CSV79_01550 [Sporosarcina sp. P13]|uniref:hypothetical protein n=1 Tax=Sporosarcina sp. P13 TaxID=2048263 RepID=UPI000C163158|nr:hypothetical protein [Sporosarcina sp. P13]PIC65334.1 hypothetical protein CSV79_01550 [Sporosarcina sp. P13]
MSIIKIQTKTPAIPIEIGELKFEFITTDENVIAFRKNGQKLLEEIELLEASSASEEDVVLLKNILRKGYDLILSEGAFDKIYEQTPSVAITAEYLVQLGNALNGELNNRGFVDQQQAKVDKYLNTKNKKK